MAHLLLAVIYISFISLGLPDSLLGASWPSIYQGFGVPVSFAGIISMIISAGTIVSSLLSDRLTKKLGTGRVNLISVGITAAALFGFSVSHSFWQLCLWAIPYGLGAGSVDASLNNYVALHYASRHMSWLHCMWGVGASVGPYLMSWALTGGQGWNMGYRMIAYIQIALTVVLLLSLPLWKKNAGAKAEENTDSQRALSLREIFRIPGAGEVMVTFFCYCALEQTAGLWAGSYMVLHGGIPAQQAASYAALLFVGVTVGRAVSGFMTLRFSDTAMVRIGQCIIAAGGILLLLPLGENAMLVGLLLVGLGCAPIYPCMLHSTPSIFGAERSQAIIGVQMASAYIGICLMPPLFGLMASRISVSLFPVFLLILLAVMAFMHERLQKYRVPQT